MLLEAAARNPPSPLEARDMAIYLGIDLAKEPFLVDVAKVTHGHTSLDHCIALACQGDTLTPSLDYSITLAFHGAILHPRSLQRDPLAVSRDLVVPLTAPPRPRSTPPCLPTGRSTRTTTARPASSTPRASRRPRRTRSTATSSSSASACGCRRTWRAGGARRWPSGTDSTSARPCPTPATRRTPGASSWT